jgi:hypothetical protein
MKKLLAFLLLALALPAFGQRVTLTVTVTNRAVTGDTLVVNGVTRYFTNAQGSSTFLTNLTSINATKTNLFKQIASYPLTALTLTDGGTNTGSASNQFRLSGTSISASLGGTWGYLTLSTQAGSSTFTMLYPVANVVGETNRTNQSSDIVAGLNGYATNLFATNAGVLGNYLTKGASTQQVVVAPVQFNGTLRAGGAVALTNGFARAITNINPVTSNLVNYGNAIRSEGSGGNSLQVGSNALALGALSVAIGNTAEADDEGTIALGTSALADGVYGTAIGVSSRASARSVAVGNTSLADSSDSVAIGYGATASQDVGISIGQGSSVTAQVGTAIGSEASVSGVRGIAIGQGAFADSHAAIAFGYGANANHSNSLALGPTDHAGNAVATTTTNQLRLGTANHTVSIPGQLLVSGTQSNTTFTGTNLARGAWAYPRYDLTTLAAGNNLAVPVGTNRFVRVGSGPASAATIVGMVGGATSGGIDGQDVVLYNDSGFSLTLAVNSVDPVPANRLNTPTATDVTIPDQGWAQFFYDGTDARWKLINAYSGTNLVATSTNLAVSTNGTLVGNGAINFTTGITGYLSGATLNLGVSAAGGGGSLVTNANQFGADTTLTIKDGALLTNVFVYGNNTNALRIASGVITSSLPAIDISQTWSNSGVTFTGFKVNVTDSNSASGSLLADLQLGGSNRFRIDKWGSAIFLNTNGIRSDGPNYAHLKLGNGFNAGSGFLFSGYNAPSSPFLNIYMEGSGEWTARLMAGASFSWTDNASIATAGTRDLILQRDAAAALQLGADAATATAQTLKAHDGSGTDKDGASLTLAGGKNTGGGTGGALITKTSLPGSGASQGNLGTRHYAYAGHKGLTDSVAVNVFEVSVPTNKYASIDLLISFRANDGFGGWAVYTVKKNFTAYNDAGTISVGESSEQSSAATDGVGTATYTISGVGTGSNTARIQVTFTSDGWAETPTSIYARWQLWINSDDIATVTPL